MHIFRRPAWLLLCGLVLAGCGSQPTAEAPAAAPSASAAAAQASDAALAAAPKASAPPACPFPDSFQDAAPDWLCLPPTPGDSLMTARGVHDAGTTVPAPSAAQLEARAELAAKEELARHLASHVRSLLQQYADSHPKIAPAAVIGKLADGLAAQSRPELLTGTRLTHSAVSPKGVAYVQVSLPPQQVQANALRVIQAGMKADKAQWRKLRTRLKPDELARAIAAGQPA